MTANKFNFRNLLNNVSLSESNEYQRIYYKDIFPHDENPYSLQDIDELADTIENCGLLEPLVVKKNQSEQYVIISGHRRYAALHLLIEDRFEKQFENIPCIVVPESTDNLLTRIMLHISNTTQRTLTITETLWAVSELKELYKECEARGIHLKGKVRERIASDLNIAPRQIQKYMTVSANADAETIAALESGNMTLNDAYEKTKKSNSTTSASPVKKLTSISKQLRRINRTLMSNSIEQAISMLEDEINRYKAEISVPFDSNG